MRQAYLLLAIILHAQGFETFEPKAFELHALLDREAFAAVRDSFEEELASVGVITITDIPDFDDLRTDALEGAHECLEYSDAAQTTVMDDGEERNDGCIDDFSRLEDSVKAMKKNLLGPEG